jgi:hypothetical protein
MSETPISPLRARMIEGRAQVRREDAKRLHPSR